MNTRINASYAGDLCNLGTWWPLFSSASIFATVSVLLCRNFRKVTMGCTDAHSKANISTWVNGTTVSPGSSSMDLAATGASEWDRNLPVTTGIWRGYVRTFTGELMSTESSFVKLPSLRNQTWSPFLISRSWMKMVFMDAKRKTSTAPETRGWSHLNEIED